MKNKICPECRRTMAFDPYFKSYICRQCGHQEDVSFTLLAGLASIERREKKTLRFVKTMQ
jgi:hypothetical protein